MLKRTMKALGSAAVIGSTVLAGMLLPAWADDTEIYTSDFQAAQNTGARPKVLIVFDDSGSMNTLVDGERPEYDPTETYTQSVNANRIYWSTNGSVPSENSSQWFNASQNRCDSSYDNLSTFGRSGTGSARRWVDSYIQQGQCSYECPAGSSYRNPPGPNNAGCYEQQTTSQPAEKLVYVRNDWSNNRCYNGLIYVDPPGGNNDACYEYVTTTDPVGGWIYRRNDGRNNWCPSGLSRLYVDPPGGNNAFDACYEYTTAPETTETTSWQWVGPRVQVCDEDIPINGNWQNLSTSVHNPTHVDCLNDVANDNPENGTSQGDGYPQDDVLNGSEYGGSIDTSIDWTGQAHTFFTSHYMNWYYDDSLVEARTRLAIAQDVVTTIIATNDQIDFGLVEFNYSEGGRVVHRIIPNMTDLQRTNLQNLVNLTDHAGSTPMCESMYEAFNYIAGRPVEYGNSAVAGSDSRGVYDVLAKDTSAESNGTYISPNTDCAYTYLILMTDGSPGHDTGANQRIKNLTGKSCINYLDNQGNNTENCLPQLTEYMANNDLDNDDSNGDQFGITYAIGFAADLPVLEDAADKGDGVYYTANDAAGLTEAFQGALTEILSEETTFTSPAVAVDTFTRTQSRDEIFYTMFEPNKKVDWIGNIKKLKMGTFNDKTLPLDADGQPAFDTNTGDFSTDARTYWSSGSDGGVVGSGGVGALLAARDPAGRSLHINTGTAGAFEALNTTNITAASMGVADATALYNLFGVSNSTEFGKQIAWAQGYDAYDKDGDTITNEARDWILGDILHSQPLVINYGARGSFTTDNPDMRLLVGSNSGFIHMFQNSNGAENWAFFPRELASILPLRRNNALSNDHIYGMDLTAVSYTQDNNGDGTLDSSAGDKVWAFLGMRRGGRSYYALDLSNPDSPAFKWKINAADSGFTELGQTWSIPQVTRIPGYFDATTGEPKPVLIFGAGYDTGKDASGVGSPDSSGRGIFIVDANTGALVWSVTPASNSATNLSETGLVHSVPGKVSVLDSNGDLLTDRIYFGDTGGNLWRVDLPGNSRPSSSQDTWLITKIAGFNGGSTTTDRRFFNAPDVVRIRFEGEAVDAIIIGSGDRTNPNATDVDNQVYMIRDERVLPYTTEAPSTTDCADTEFYDFRCSLPLTVSDLYDASTNVLNTGTDAEKATASEALRAANGWAFDLSNAGEKSLAKTLTLEGKVYVNTYTPSNLLDDISICDIASGTALTHILDLYDVDRSVVVLGSIIPDTPSLYFGDGDDCGICILLPPGAPASDDEDLKIEGGVGDPGVDLRKPYGNYWFQEAYQ